MSQERTSLEEYFPEDVRNKKEMEFLELNQGSLEVEEIFKSFT